MPHYPYLYGVQRIVIFVSSEILFGASPHFQLRLSHTGGKRNLAEILPPIFPEKTEPLLFYLT